MYEKIQIQEKFGWNEAQLEFVLNSCEIDLNRDSLSDSEYQKICDFLAENNPHTLRAQQSSDWSEQLTTSTPDELFTKLVNKEVNWSSQIEQLHQQSFFTSLKRKLLGLNQAVEEELRQRSSDAINIYTTGLAFLERQRLEGSQPHRLPPTSQMDETPLPDEQQ